MRFASAQWHGDTITNETHGKMFAHHGVVLHIICGSLAGADSWFHNPKAQVSAHFGVGKDGTLYQWVDTDDTAWAEVAGNHYWLSCELEGFSGDQLTQGQAESVAKLFAWAHRQYGFPVQVTADVTRPGLGHHSMGGADWGGHFTCPGEPIIAEKPNLVHRARALLDFPVEHPKPAPVPEPKHPLPAWYHRVLEFVPGEPLLHGPDVATVQRKVHVQVDGLYGPSTAAKVRGFQQLKKLQVDGKVGPMTANALGA